MFVKSLAVRKDGNRKKNMVPLARGMTFLSVHEAVDRIDPMFFPLPHDIIVK